MLSPTAWLLLLAYLVAVAAAAHRDWWVQGLPSCWQSCLGITEDGCSSTKCICKTTEDSVSYLPSAVACAVSQCEADDWAIELVLGPLQLYCAAIECPIPDDVMEDAYAAATQTAKQPTQTKPPTQPSAPKQSDHKSTKGSDSEQDLTSTIRTTITRTTTDSSGNTLQVIVPVVMGPTGISTGKPITSTVDGEASSTRPSASTAASLSTTTGASGPALTQGPTSTSAGGSQATGRPANGNGSPFENMQAGAGRWVVSAPLLGLGVTAVLFWSWEL